MKAGDKVICIDDSAGRNDGVTTLVKNKVYEVLRVSVFHANNIFVNDGTELSWTSNRFRKVETYTSKVSCVKFKEIKEGLDIQVPQLV